MSGLPHNIIHLIAFMPILLVYFESEYQHHGIPLHVQLPSSSCINCKQGVCPTLDGNYILTVDTNKQY